MVKINKIKLLAISILAAFSMTAQAGGILVANTSVSENELKSKDVSRIFLGKTTKLSGGKINPCYINTIDESGQYFFEQIVKKDHNKFKKYWTKKLFAGSGVAPKTFDSDSELMDYVQKTKGAICFVTATADASGVKVVNIDGKDSF